MNWPEIARELVAEIDQLRALVRALHEPAWMELGPACEDIDSQFRDVLDGALGAAPSQV